MPDFPITPDFPRLPEKLRKIVGDSEIRDYESAVELWRRNCANVTVQYNTTVLQSQTEQTVKNFLATTSVIQQSINQLLPNLVSFYPPKLCQVLVNAGTPFAYAAFLDGYPVATIISHRKMLCRDVSDGKYFLFSPPPIFQAENVLGGFPNTTADGVIRTGYQVRQVKGAPPNDHKAIEQVWYPGYNIRSLLSGTYVGAFVYISSISKLDYDLKPSGLTFQGNPVYNGAWFDLNVNASTWQHKWVIVAESGITNNWEAV